MNDMHKEIFSQIYKNKAWENHLRNKDVDGISKSGPGSDYSFMKPYIPELEKFLVEFNIKTWLDVGCGDWAWTQHMVYKGDYVGIDVAEEIILENENKYVNNNKVKCGSTRKFLCLNAVTDVLPQADFVLCKDVMIHLPISDCLKLINNVKNSGCKYIGATSYRECVKNDDIKVGSWSPRNYFVEPFKFGEPVFEIYTPEKILNDVHHRSILIWEVNAVE